MRSILFSKPINIGNPWCIGPFEKIILKSYFCLFVFCYLLVGKSASGNTVIFIALHIFFKIHSFIKKTKNTELSY